VVGACNACNIVWEVLAVFGGAQIVSWWPNIPLHLVVRIKTLPSS